MLLGFGALGVKIKQLSTNTDHESIQRSGSQHKSSGVLETGETARLLLTKDLINCSSTCTYVYKHIQRSIEPFWLEETFKVESNY